MIAHPGCTAVDTDKTKNEITGLEHRTSGDSQLRLTTRTLTLYLHHTREAIPSALNITYLHMKFHVRKEKKDNLIAV